MTGAALARTLPERVVLALTLWSEARSEDIAGRVAVGCVIRTRASRRTQTVTDVCLAPMQFSCWNEDTTKNHKVLVAMAESIASGHPVTDKILVECLWIADGILSGACQDITRGADHYVTTALLSSSHKPGWIRHMAWTATVGAHAFYRS